MGGFSASCIVHTSVFSVHVHDSDFWMYALYRRGELIDQFASMDMNDYFGGETFGEDASMMGSGSVEWTLDERWDVLFDYLAEGVLREAFDQAMQLADPTVGFDAMGEEGLGRFFTLLSVDSSLANLSYRYWMEDPGDDSLQEHSHLLLEEG